MHPRFPFRSLPGAAALAIALGAVACTTTPTTTNTNVSDESSLTAAVLVRPAQFIGDTACSSAPGAMRSYVATLIDVTLSEPCGDGICNSIETRESCPRDCPAKAATCGASGQDPCPPHTCGNGTCGDKEIDANGNPLLDSDGNEVGAETKDTCPVDCGGEIAPPFTFPSSLPTPCAAGVRFDNIVGGHVYTLEIEGYEGFAYKEAPGDVTHDGEIGPTGWADQLSKTEKVSYASINSGSRHMEDVHGNPVLPRWFGSCGENERKPTVAAASGTTLIVDCDPLVDKGTKAETAVVLDPRDTLGGLACAAAGGLTGVGEFDVLSLDGLPDHTGIACADGSLALFTGDGLVPGKGLQFFVQARKAPGAPVSWGAMCAAVVEDGITVRAACSPLSDRGSLRVDFPAVLSQFGYACGGDFETYDVTFTANGEPSTQTDIPCADPTVISPLVPGTYETKMSVHAKDGQQIFSATCKGEVFPGRTTSAADCALK